MIKVKKLKDKSPKKIQTKTTPLPPKPIKL